MNTKNSHRQARTQEAEEGRAQEGRAQGQAAGRHGPRLEQEESQEDGQGPAQALERWNAGARTAHDPMSQLLRTKSIDALIAASEDPAGTAAQDAGALEPDGAGHRRGHRLRHLHPHRHGGGGRDSALPVDPARPGAGPAAARLRRRLHHRPAGRGPGDRPLVPADRHGVRLRRALLRRAGLDDPHRRQRLHLRLRHAGRDLRLDHRLGPDPGVRRLQHGRGGGLLRLSQRHSGERLRRPPAQGTVRAHDRRRRVHRKLVQPARARGPAGADGDPGARRQGERRDATTSWC